LKFGDKEAMRIKTKVLLILLMLLSFCIVSCIYHTAERKKALILRQVTHSRVEELERYVYDRVGPDIYFGKPDIDDAKHTAALYLIQPDSHFIDALFEEARCAINDYLTENPDCFLKDDYKIDLYYCCRLRLPHDDYDDLVEGHSCNYFSYNGLALNRNENIDELNFPRGMVTPDRTYYYARIEKLYDSISVVDSWSWGWYGYTNLYGSDTVEVLDISSDSPDYEQIMDIIKNIPSLQYIYIYSWDGDVDELLEGLYNANSNVIILPQMQ